MQRLVRVDGKVRTDTTYPAGFMDVITIDKTGEHFRLIYDTKGRFAVHRIRAEEAEYKLGKVSKSESRDLNSLSLAFPTKSVSSIAKMFNRSSEFS